MHDIAVRDRVAFDLTEVRRLCADMNDRDLHQHHRNDCLVTIFQSFNLETYLMAFTVNVGRQYFVVTREVCIKS